MGLSTVAQNRENLKVLVKICPQGTNAVEQFFTKLGAGRVSQVHTLTPNFTVVALKM